MAEQVVDSTVVEVAQDLDAYLNCAGFDALAEMGGAFQDAIVTIGGSSDSDAGDIRASVILAWAALLELTRLLDELEDIVTPLATINEEEDE